MDTFVHISSSSDYMSLKDLDFKEDLDMLFNAILELKDIDECYKFFEDGKISIWIRLSIFRVAD